MDGSRATWERERRGKRFNTGLRICSSSPLVKRANMPIYQKPTFLGREEIFLLRSSAKVMESSEP
jgi:hypothetical protein